MKRKLISWLLILSMVCGIMPLPSLAAEGPTQGTPTVNATIRHNLNDGGKPTGQMVAQVEAYLTDDADRTRTVNPSDIIFVVEQSSFMNTQTDSATGGDERAMILEAMNRMLTNLPKPTTEGEHRVALAGYGRIKSADVVGDSYNPALHPGTPISREENASLNTGYYTYEGGKPKFHSEWDWTEWNSDGNEDKTKLPQMPDGYLVNEPYNDVFMTIDQAKDIINADEMIPWYARAARMDAGLEMSQALADIAEKHDSSRNLIVCIVTSSLPYQNQGDHKNQQSIRTEAAIAGAKVLKEQYGATIFGFGDFQKLNLDPNEFPNLQDYNAQRNHFNNTMATICGDKDTNATTGAEYFKGLSQSHDIEEALTDLMTKIDETVGQGETQTLAIDEQSFKDKADGKMRSWNEIKKDHHLLTSSNIKETASVEYYRFAGYDSNGQPTFDENPYRHTDFDLADIGKGDSLKTSLKILPIPPKTQSDEAGGHYGEKAVITVTDPVCINYQWLGRWAAPFNPPAHEHATRGSRHYPATPTQNENSGDELDLKFDGWYRLWNDAVDNDANTAGKKIWNYNGQKYVEYTGTLFPAFGNDLELYGRWVPSIHVYFQWSGAVIPEKNGQKIEPPLELEFALNDDGKVFCMPVKPKVDGYEFDGWYKDATCTKKFNDNGESITRHTALYGRWTKIGTQTVTFKVENGKWNPDSAWIKDNDNVTYHEDSGDVTVEVPLRDGKGSLTSALIPIVDRRDMTPNEEYKSPGTWGTNVPNTTANGIVEGEHYEYTYTFPEKDTYTITYRWTGDTTDIPENVSLPVQDVKRDGTQDNKPTFDIAKVSDQTNDDKWTFEGWYTTPNPTENEEPPIKEESSYQFNGNERNRTLYGRWTHKPCIVTFRADYLDMPNRGGMLKVDGKQQEMVSYEVPYGSTLKATGKALPYGVPSDSILDQWYFSYWDLENDGLDDVFYSSPDISEITVREDMTFVAQWWPIVSFDANGGRWALDGNKEERHMVVLPNTQKIYPLRPPTREGYTFLGWYDKAESGEKIDFKTQTFTGPDTVYAHWGQNATVTFKIENGAWSPDGSKKDKNVSVLLENGKGTLPIASVPVEGMMVPDEGFDKASGHWDKTPNTDENGITGDITYTYRFEPKDGGGGGTGGGGTVVDKVTLHYESNGGTVYPDERYSKNKVVKLDKFPAREGYRFTGWYADEALTEKISDIKMTSDQTVYAGWRAATVPDWLNGEDHFAYVVGYPNGTVGPLGSITRAETATIFFRLLQDEVRDGNLTESGHFDDVKAGEWYTLPIYTMNKLGILMGRTDKVFAPQASITRAEFAAICARFDTGVTEEYQPFTDISGHWAEKDIERAAALGWVQGDPSGRFHPDDKITRAEAMAMINRVLCRIPEKASDLLPDMNVWPDNQPNAWYYLPVQEATNSHEYKHKGEVHEKWTAMKEDPDWSRYNP